MAHGTFYGAFNLESPYVKGVVGADFSVFGTYDAWQHASPDHEFNFWNVDNPYQKAPASSDCKGTWDEGCNEDGFSISKAVVKLKYKDSLYGSAGLFQPNVPSALGTNWAFAPGTYRGGQGGVNLDKLSLGIVWSDEYKASWYKETFDYQERNSLMEYEDVGDLYSFGARYQLSKTLKFDTGYAGLTGGDREIAHIKLYYNHEKFYLTPQLYIVDSDNQYDHTAWQFAFKSGTTIGVYDLKFEATYSYAPSDDTRGLIGNFVYRPTEEYGSSNGAYDIWWNARSDWNHDGEYAGFVSVNRSFKQEGLDGFSAGFSLAGGKGPNAKGYKEFKEYAINLFTDYTFQKGFLEGMTLSLYLTEYVNLSDAPSWSVYSNGFQDETDFKAYMIWPLSL